MARPDAASPRSRGDDALVAKVRDAVTPVAESLEVDLIDVEVKGQKGRRVVRLIADALDPSAGLDVETIATLSRRAGDQLDEDDLVPGAYTLEVSSPGATRPLRQARDFARNVGREVDVLRAEEHGDPRSLRGEVTEVDDEVVTLVTADGQVRVPLAEIDHGKVVLPW
jgi:ribosome maturation factor RimP